MEEAYASGRRRADNTLGRVYSTGSQPVIKAIPAPTGEITGRHMHVPALAKVVCRLRCTGVGVVGCVTVDVGSGPVPAAAPPVASCGRLGRAGVSRGEALATVSLRTCCFKSCVLEAH